jgi:hypothetical protein
MVKQSLQPEPELITQASQTKPRGRIMSSEGKTSSKLRNFLRWIAVLPVSIISYIIVWHVIGFLSPFISWGPSVFGRYAPVLLNAFICGSTFVASGSKVAPLKRSIAVPIILTILFCTFVTLAILGVGVAPGKNVTGTLEIWALILASFGCMFTTFLIFSSPMSDA